MDQSLKPASSIGVDPGLFPDENPNPVMRFASDGTLTGRMAERGPAVLAEADVGRHERVGFAA